MDTPFSEYKATELCQSRLIEYFVEPKYISKMYSNNVAFIIGQRGTGKTTMLRYLEEKYNSSIKTNKRIGIYYRFDTNKMHSFSGAALTENEWSILFAHCFSIEICMELTELMISLKKENDFSTESKICKKIARLFLDDTVGVPSTFEELEVYLDEIDYKAKKYKRNPLSVPPPIYGDCEKTFETFCSLISRESFLKGVCIHFLLDEYENMLDYQKRFINSCAKNASSFHTYKICVRPGVIECKNTVIESEILREADDYKTLDYITEILGGEKDIEEFMKNACKMRLESYYRSRNIECESVDLDIENYFPQIKTEDELFLKLEHNKQYTNRIREDVIAAFNELGRDYTFQWGLLQMKLFLALKQKKGFDFNKTLKSIETKDTTYKNWLNNYKKTLLFQCYLEQNENYCLSGFKDIINIAGNVVRYVLEICDYCFLCTDCYDDGKYMVISERMQTEATKMVSERRFKQISTIPVYGQEIKQMVFVVGNIFRMYHMDSRVKRFETNHFSIKSGSKNVCYKEINDAIELAVMYGAFIESRSTKSIIGADVPLEDKDFHLHPILTPYFQISWRKKQKCRFTLDEVNEFLFDTDGSVTKILSNYKTKIYNNADVFKNEQLSFVD